MSWLLENGRLPPAIVSIVILVAFGVGCLAGWVAHANWSIRGEADQLVEDAKIEKVITEDNTERMQALENNIEATESYTDDCLDRNHEYFVNELRRSRGATWDWADD